MTAVARVSRTVETVTVGEVVDAVSLPLSLQKLVMIAAANRDFAPTHHDPELARATGADTAYGNMMFVMAMLERTVLAWAGPAARIRSFNDVRMMAFNRAVDVVTCRGRVASVDLDAREVRLELWLETAPDRRTASATTRVALT